MSFSQVILEWYATHKRALPWRATKDPYFIWLSEIILQQTRVAQGIPYYKKFVSKFPTVSHLAAAPEDEVLKLWQGLGYYSRARNLHATAKKITHEMGGKFPNSYAELVQLKGIGDYLSRYFGVETPINDAKSPKYFKDLARKVMSLENIRDYNQGIMEFGALQCAPKNPDCSQCPLSNSCVALQKKIVHKLPIKLKKTKIRKRYFNYLLVLGKNKKGAIVSLLNQRKGRGIWENLWEFPLVETNNSITLNELMVRLPTHLNKEEITEIVPYNEKEIVHKLSHQHLYTRFWILKTSETFSDGIPFDKLEEYAVPVLIADVIKAYKI